MLNITQAGQFSQLARQGAIIVIALALPRLGVGPEVIGRWETLLYLGYLLGFGWLTGLLQAYLVRVRRARPALAALFSRWAVGSVGVFSAVLLGVVAGLHEPLFALLRLGDAPPGWGYFFLFLLTQWPGLFFEQVLLARERVWLLVGFSGLSGLGMVVCLLGPLYLGWGLGEALGVLAVFAGVKGFVLVTYLLSEWFGDRFAVFLGPQSYTEEAQSSAAHSLGWVGGSLRDEEGEPLRGILGSRSDAELPSLEARQEGQESIKTVLLNWLTAAWPLMGYASVGALVTAFDPWFVNYWYGGDEATFAVFRYGAREIPLLGALTNGLIIAALPRLSEHTDAGLALLRESSRRLYHWVFGGACLLMLSAPWWWTAVFTEVFAESLPLFRVYLFVIVSRLLFPLPVLTALGHTRWLMVFGVLELAVNILLSLLLAPAYGLVGIIWATVIAYLVDKVCLVVYLDRTAGIGLLRYTDLRWFLGYVVLLGIAYLV